LGYSFYGLAAVQKVNLLNFQNKFNFKKDTKQTLFSFNFFTFTK